MDTSATGYSKHSVNGSGRLWAMTGYSRVTTFIGAGGKTTCLQSITQEIESAGQPVVATTTTKVYPEEHMSAWKSFDLPPAQKGAYFWYDRVEDKSGKWIGPSVSAVDKAIAEDFRQRYWVIEGDGARGCKLKCWEVYEPQIPNNTDCGVLVLDRNLWGNVLQTDQVHRFYLCKDLIGQAWGEESAWNYFLSSPVFAPQYGQMFWVILLNGPKENQETKKMDLLDLLKDLRSKWVEIQKSPLNLEKRPRHLRLAAGDAKEGDLRWLDLW